MFVPKAGGCAALVTPQSEMCRARRRRCGRWFEGLAVEEGEDEGSLVGRAGVEDAMELRESVGMSVTMFVMEMDWVMRVLSSDSRASVTRAEILAGVPSWFTLLISLGCGCRLGSGFVVLIDCTAVLSLPTICVAGTFSDTFDGVSVATAGPCPPDSMSFVPVVDVILASADSELSE